MNQTDHPAFEVKPHRVRQIVIPVAVALVVVFVVTAILLRSGSTGVRFGVSDQVSIVLIGLALGAGCLVFIRPRVRADAEGVEVRNVLLGQRLPWSMVKAVSFPDGAPWARLELPQDEYVPVVAIQAVDGERAVRAMRELRAIHRESTRTTEPPSSDEPAAKDEPAVESASTAEPAVTAEVGASAEAEASDTA